jgi:hypothetical protein
VSFSTITLCAASQQVFVVVAYFVIDSVRKLLDTPSYITGFQVSLPRTVSSELHFLLQDRLYEERNCAVAEWATKIRKLLITKF